MRIFSPHKGHDLWRKMKTFSNAILNRPTDSKSVILAGALLASFAPALAAPVTPKSVDSIGVNTHLQAGGLYANNATVVAKLQDLGVKHIRDGLTPNSSGHASDVGFVCANTPVKATVITDWGGNAISSWGSTDVLRVNLNQIVTNIGAGNVAVIEGPNEPNLSKPYSAWATDTANWTRRLWDLTRTDAAYTSLAGKAILGTGLAGNNKSTDATTLKSAFTSTGDGRAIENFVTYAGIHPYPSAGRPPEEVIQTEINTDRSLYPTKPFMPSETGYHNGVNTGGAAPEEAVGIYAPRLALDYFAFRNMPRTFWYELFDEDLNGNGATDNSNAEETFGIYRLDGSPKPAAKALKNLISVLNDTGTPALSPLDYTLSNANVRSVLLRRSNGDYYLATWLPQNVTTWSVTPAVMMYPADQSCTLTLASSASVTSYDGLDSTLSTTSLGTGTTFNFTSSERVKIFKIGSAVVTTNLSPTGDTFVRDGSYGNDINGSATTMLCKNVTSASSYTRWSYVKFDTTGLGTISSAKVRVYANLSTTSPASMDVSVYGQQFTSSSPEWSESTLTWNNKTLPLSTALATKTVTGTGQVVYEWDVTTFARSEASAGRRKFGLVFKAIPANTEAAVIFNSKEATSNKPVLVVQSQ